MLIHALKITLTVYFTLFLFIVHGQVAPVVPEDCIGCICQASSNCNLTIPCTNGVNGQQYLCGPFLISWPYWADAGKFILANDHPDRKGAFEDCVKDAVCAGETVRGYMSKFAQDCNKDGVINCDDFARIHILGGYGCNSPVEEIPFYKNYLQCRQTVASLSG